MMLVGVEEGMDAVGELRGNSDTAAAGGWFAMGDSARDMPMEERGRDVTVAVLARVLENALMGLKASKEEEA